MASKLKVDAIETGDGTGTIALSNQFTGMSVASLPTTGTLPAMDGSALTNLPAGGVLKYFNAVTYAGTGGSSITTSTAWFATGVSITIPSADITGLSRLFVTASNSCRINENTHALSEWRLQRITPSAVNYNELMLGAAVDSPGEIYTAMSLVADDSSLGSGDHKYEVYVRIGTGAAPYGGSIYYKYKAWSLTVMGT